ncbi:hypothetical protein BX616_000786 [Lobosporangium transversale]|uniref:Uncharacterized protein n=1 Tax=Lobosporangium transversale TaxID=64571 RepID=A0A1Y2GUK3_9FUNG|nr:hypothetical protein BCR41DRAFT_421300 [Lobosporangium transversale]KAF9906203.1 hypothetical protein BX616_000786 [Lobosporangium transversale]ORZ19101.1 hypothetical protein BCR41DRAFT_421300 [Lobosporangium transversale]|eukprot:XP_021882269.1 hypothetical protein BCR41DRAFT_421300 [Lobosporangium transversale]
MHPSQSGRTVDKENDIVSETSTTARGAGPHAPLFKQNSSLIGTNRTQSTKLQNPLKGELPKTPSLQRKGSNLTVNSPMAASVLRTKTNFQQPSPTVDLSNTTNSKGKSSLTRTFSALEANQNNSSSNNFLSTSPTQSESRRRSLTRRGSAKTRLIIHKDEPGTSQVEEPNIIPMSTKISTSETITATDKNNTNGSDKNKVKDAEKEIRPATALVRSAPVESATTLLSVERAAECQEKIVVGAAENTTKRRALENEDDLWDIEYCPPPVEEQSYDPGFDLDPFALTTAPPDLAYNLRSLKELDDDLDETTLPVMDANTRRPSSPQKMMTGAATVAKDADAPMPKSTITSDGYYDIVWEDDREEMCHVQNKGHGKNGLCFGIKDLEDESKTRPPFDGFVFDLDEASEESLSEDEDDILGVESNQEKVISKTKTADPVVKDVGEFNETLGLGDLENQDKVQVPFSDFTFDV